MELDYLKAIVAMLILLLSWFGIAIPQSALDLVGNNPPQVTQLPPPTPTQEIIDSPSSYRTFTPHLGYKINLRANCSRSALVLMVITDPVQIDTSTLFTDNSGYRWARTSSGACIAIALNNSTYGVIQ